MKPLILIITLATMAVGQDTIPKGKFFIGADKWRVSGRHTQVWSVDSMGKKIDTSTGNIKFRVNSRELYSSRGQLEYWIDTNKVFHSTLEYINGLWGERDSLKRRNLYLEKMLRVYVESSIEVNNAFLKSGIVDSATVKRSMKVDKDILKGLRK